MSRMQPIAGAAAASGGGRQRPSQPWRPREHILHRPQHRRQVRSEMGPQLRARRVPGPRIERPARVLGVPPEQGACRHRAQPTVAQAQPEELVDPGQDGARILQQHPAIQRQRTLAQTQRRRFQGVHLHAPDQGGQLQVGQPQQIGRGPAARGVANGRQAPEPLADMDEAGPALPGDGQDEAFAIRIEQQHPPPGQGGGLGDQGVGAVRRLDQDPFVRLEPPAEQAEHGLGQVAGLAEMPAPLHGGQDHQGARLLQGQAPSRRVQAGRQQGRGAVGGVPDEIDGRRLGAEGRQFGQGECYVSALRRAPAVVQEWRGRQARAIRAHEPRAPGARIEIVKEQGGVTGVEPALGEARHTQPPVAEGATGPAPPVTVYTAADRLISDLQPERAVPT